MYSGMAGLKPALKLESCAWRHRLADIQAFTQNQDSTGEAVVLLTKYKDHTCLRQVLRTVTHPVGNLLQRINEAILHASHVGDAQSVEQLLAAGGDASCEDKYSNSALILAAQHGNTERQAAVTNLLTAAGANPDKLDMGGRSALHWASLSGHTPVVKQLVAAGAALDQTDSTLGYTPLMLAARHGHSEILHFLIEHKASVNTPDMFGETALFDALRQDHVECVELLIEAGAHMDIVDKRSRTPLLTAILWNNNPGVVLRLIRENIPLDQPGQMFNRAFCMTEDFCTPLDAAILKEKITITKVLLTAGAKAGSTCRKNLELWEDLEAKGSILKFLQTPRTLLHLCRCVTRRTLGVRMNERLNGLPLPRPLREYLCIPELWEF